MFYHPFLLILVSLLHAAVAWQAPSYSGYNRIWQQTFTGNAGTVPSSNDWVFMLGDKNYNNEAQRYTNNRNNIRFSGKGTLQIIPRYDTSVPRKWTSSRIESKYSMTPTAGKITRIEASIRLGENAQRRKQGIWPAFWMLGESHRRGVAWPTCGELDILESINGQPTVYASMHCDRTPGGICNEPSGLGTGTSLRDSNYHVWRIEMDRRNSDWKKQSITWFRDGTRFHQVTGTRINNFATWRSLCQSPYYIILNVAVGGNWPGPPNQLTWGGAGSMMEVGYIAHYVSR